MAKIVYIIGAGASRGYRHSDKLTDKEQKPVDDIIEGLPVVAEMPERLEYICSILSNIIIEDKDNEAIRYEGAKDVKDGIRELIDGLQWLKKESQNHATIDTFAKKLFLKQEFDDFEKVKKLLAVYFTIEQIINKSDARYDTFLANVLTEELKIPDELCIVTWNYDSFFELAFQEYRGKFKQSSEIGCYSINDKVSNYDNATIFKVNGTASFDNWNSAASFTNNNKNELTVILIKEILKGYFLDKSKLDFAWENEKAGFEKEFFGAIHNRIKDATTLVVIGYTFPFFNRKMDKWILEQMPSLREIYIQDIRAEMLQDNVYAVIPSSKKNLFGGGIEILPKKNCDQFFLPPEL